MSADPPPIDPTLMDPIMAQFNGRSRDALLPMLHCLQDVYGWLPEAALQAASRTLRVPLADIHGVVEFYSMFYNQPMARRVIRVCEDAACSRAGCHDVMAAIETVMPMVTSAVRAIALSPCPTGGRSPRHTARRDR